MGQAGQVQSGAGVALSDRAGLRLRRQQPGVAERLGISRPTVTKWRSRFVARRLEGLADEPRPGAARTITDEQVEQVLVMTLEATPKDATHWSTRSLARATGMSQSAISRIWRAFGLKPHLVDTFKLSTDPQFIEKVRDVVGLYLHPPEAALVLCVDEKSSIQALDRPAPILPLLPGVPGARPMTMSVTAPPICMPPWMWPRARSSPS